MPSKLNRQLERAGHARYDTAMAEIAAVDARLQRFEATLCNRFTRSIVQDGSLAEEVERALDQITNWIGHMLTRIIAKTQRQGIQDAKAIIPSECYDEEVDALSRTRGPEGLRVARISRPSLPVGNRPAPGQLLNESQRELLPEVLPLRDKHRIVLRQLADDERYQIITTSFVEGQRRTWDRRIVAIGRRIKPRSMDRTLSRNYGEGATRRQIKDAACAYSSKLISQARTIARTEGLRVYRLTDDHILRKFDQCLVAYTYWTMDDSRVRPHHYELHGRVYRKREDGSFTDRSGNDMPIPPWEPNCRCWLTPLFNSSITGEQLWQNQTWSREISRKRLPYRAAQWTQPITLSEASRSWARSPGTAERTPTEPCKVGCHCTRTPRSTSITTTAAMAEGTRTTSATSRA